MKKLFQLQFGTMFQMEMPLFIPPEFISNKGSLYAKKQTWFIQPF